MEFDEEQETGTDCLRISTHFELFTFPLFSFPPPPPHPWAGYGLLGSPVSLKKTPLSRQTSGESVADEVEDRFETHDPESIHALMNEGAQALAKVLSVPVHWARAILSSHDWNLNDAALAWRNDSVAAAKRARIKLEVAQSQEAISIAGPPGEGCGVCMMDADDGVETMGFGCESLHFSCAELSTVC